MGLVCTVGGNPKKGPGSLENILLFLLFATILVIIVCRLLGQSVFGLLGTTTTRFPLIEREYSSVGIIDK